MTTKIRQTTRIRQTTDVTMRLLCGASTAFLGLMVTLVLAYVIREGLHSVTWSFLTHIPTPPMIPGGGMGNQILGSLVMVAMASMMAIPAGILCAVYLVEYGKGPFAEATRFLIEVLNGIPTIVFGILAYELVVMPMHTFSAYAGAVALAVIMVPLVARATESAVRQVPRSWREASIALGASPARTILSVVLPGARAGIITGGMLAIARAAGETAPLVFTALGNESSWPRHLNQATAALPLQVFKYAISPFPDQQAQAWAGAFVLVIGVLALNILVRVLARADSNLTARM